jgi:hypothetical protein
MRNDKKPIPLGCFVIVVIIVALYFTFKGDSPEEKKWKEEDARKLAEYKSKFDYDIDSITNTIQAYNYEPNQEKIKVKCLILEEQGGKYVINLRRMSPEQSPPNYKMPENLIAYKLKDLNTIIIHKYDRVRTSNWGAPTVERDQVELSFYDVGSSRVLYKTTIIGSGQPYVVERGRRAGAMTYFLSNAQIISEILRIVEHSF